MTGLGRNGNRSLYPALWTAALRESIRYTTVTGMMLAVLYVLFTSYGIILNAVVVVAPDSGYPPVGLNPYRLAVSVPVTLASSAAVSQLILLLTTHLFRRRGRFLHLASATLIGVSAGCSAFIWMNVTG